MSEKRALSSHPTTLLKFVLPAAWTTFIGIRMLALPVKSGAPSAGAWLVFWPVGLAVLYVTYGHLKRVKMDSEALYISNYWGREVRVPLEHVSDITESTHFVIVGLTMPCEFGSSIAFIPKVQFRVTLLPEEHPVVNEIRLAAWRATRAWTLSAQATKRATQDVR